jgi:PBSX family phage terminase large subunit
MNQISLTQKQAEFLTSTNFATLFAAGVGSGKSFIGSHWAKEKIISEPKSRGFIAANTYNQLRNATLATFFGVLDEHNFKYRYNQQRNIIDVNGTIIYAYSLDNYQNIRGIEIGWGWLDETRDTPREAFDVVLGRLRDKRAKKLELRLTSSPCGYNWLYDYFAGPNKKSGYHMVQGSTFDNPYLPPSYVESLRESYDDKMYQQEVLGQFVTTGVGQVYYSFNRTRNVRAVGMDPKYPLMIGMDFNINPMSAVVFQCVGPEIRVIDEISLMSSDTSEMGKHILAKFGRVRVIPDSTGKRKQTSSKGLSDHQILRDMGHEVVYNANPARFDRYVCVNNLLEKDRLVIDPKCKHLIADLEKVTYRPGTTEPDSTTDKSLTHMSDALGYGCWFCFPVIKHQSGVGMLDR